MTFEPRCFLFDYFVYKKGHGLTEKHLNLIHLKTTQFCQRRTLSKSFTAALDFPRLAEQKCSGLSAKMAVGQKYLVPPKKDL